MADEVGGSGLDENNAWWEVREDTNKVTEEAVRRVQDDQKKAQQVGQEIKNDKASNNRFAKFLTFLLKDIKNDHIIKQIYQVFLKHDQEETNVPHKKKWMNTALMVGIFAPFYQDEINEYKLEALYQDIFTFDGNIDLTKYIKYIKQLLAKYHNNMSINKQEFTKLLIHITEYYHLTEKLSTENTKEFEDTIKKELSSNE